MHGIKDKICKEFNNGTKKIRLISITSHIRQVHSSNVQIINRIIMFKVSILMNKVYIFI